MPRSLRPAAVLFPAICALALGGCAEGGFLQGEDLPQEIKNLSKSDIDFVMDAHLRQTEQSLAELMKTLYVLNPRQLAKAVGATAEERVARILPAVPYQELRFVEIGSVQDVEAMLIALDRGFGGDRVFALMVGIVSQMRIAFNHQTEFFLTDTLDPENMMNFEANLSIIRDRLLRNQSWLLDWDRDAAEPPLRALDERFEQTEDQSIRWAPALRVRDENIDALRILDRMIGQLHLLNAILQSREQRNERSAVQAAGTVTLLPIGGAAGLY